jgi:hypothetical protein
VDYIKVEILLPLRDNDDKSIDDAKFEAVYDYLNSKYQGVTIRDTPVIGKWIDPSTKIIYKEKNTACWVACEKTETNINDLKNYRLILKEQFGQISIMMYYVNVHTL